VGRPAGALGINQDNNLHKLRFRFRNSQRRIPQISGIRRGAGALGSPVFLRALFVGGLQLAAFVTLDALPRGLFGATRLFLRPNRIILVVARPREPALRVAVAPLRRHRTTPL
jgi:hypothetical protein